LKRNTLLEEEKMWHIKGTTEVGTIGGDREREKRKRGWG